jgi:hypothetical protein
MLDRAKLAKILARTSSQNDNERLVALNMANAMVNDAGTTWEAVLAESLFNVVNIEIQRAPPPASAYQQEDGWTPPHLNDKDAIQLMFKTVFALPRSGNDEFWEWMDSIHRRFQEHGNLTPKQYSGLRRTYQRALRSSRA